MARYYENFSHVFAVLATYCGKVAFAIDEMDLLSVDACVIQSLQQAHFYGILDLGYVKPEDVIATARAFCAGGADLVQLRAKGLTVAEILPLAEAVRPIFAAAGIPFIINDFAEIAVAVKADGLHLGQEDGSLAEARAIVGDRMLIGRSTHSLEQAKAAYEEGFDYLGFGPLFPTPTKLGRPGIGLKNVKVAQQQVGEKIPLFCIGGITPNNLTEVIRAGAQRAVIVSAILRAPDIASAIREVKAQLSASA